MSCPASRGAPRTPASLLVAASSSGTLNTASSFSIRASTTSEAVGREEESGCLECIVGITEWYDSQTWLDSPAAYHEAVDDLGTTRWWRKAIASLYLHQNL